MVRFLVPAAAFAMLLVGAVGCQKHDAMGDSPKMMSADVCPHCPGVQKATADGKCEMCGAKVADACPTCPGVQVATADGKCPMCGAKVAK
jgi:hypothetical protein